MRAPSLGLLAHITVIITHFKPMLRLFCRKVHGFMYDVQLYCGIQTIRVDVESLLY